jgi:TRAP-type C4-dicarboxylate transport system permease small subunit
MGGETTSPRPHGGEGRQRPFLRLLVGVKTLIEWSGRGIAVACLGVMFAALLVNVILRYAFGDGISWAYEIHALLLPWTVGAGIVIAAAKGRNIAITILPDILPPVPLKLLTLTVQTLILVIAVSVLWTCQPILRAAQFQTLSTLGIKQIWGYYSLVYAFGAMALIAALDIIRILSGTDVTDHDPGHASLS